MVDWSYLSDNYRVWYGIVEARFRRGGWRPIGQTPAKLESRGLGGPPELGAKPFRLSDRARAAFRTMFPDAMLLAARILLWSMAAVLCWPGCSQGPAKPKPAKPAYIIVSVRFLDLPAPPIAGGPKVVVLWREPGDRVAETLYVDHNPGWQDAADKKIRLVLAERRSAEAIQRQVERESKQWPRK
jgi:hypothetical protein